MEHILKYDTPSKHNVMLAAYYDRVAATVRYEDEKGINAGDYIGMVDKNEEMFANGEVNLVCLCPVAEALDIVRSRNMLYGISSTGVLKDVLNKYYDDDVLLESTVKVIGVFPELLEEE